MAKVPFCDGMVLLHNPRCSKSRAAKALLEERGVAFECRLYLERPLTGAELRELHQRLGRPVREWVRRGEAAYAEAGLSQQSSDVEGLAAIERFPVLLERPILITAHAAAVGRPPETILPLLDAGA